MFNSTKEPENKYEKRREIVFLLFAGLFIGTLAMLNILGISRLIDLSFKIGSITFPLRVFVGVLPYPITFLCTDFISEFYGKKRASNVVWIGFILNLWVVFILWIGGILPPVPQIESLSALPSDDPNYIFYQIRHYTFSTTFASMVAYLTAQFVDVHVFHYLKKRTAGKKLWIRNNGSTLTSQLIDSLAVVLITFTFTTAIKVPDSYSVTEFLLILIFSNYLFKFAAALLDTIPFYLGVKFLKKYLDLDPVSEFNISPDKK
ncbi:MAG: queuosine precursor transporter [Bacteroidales bacterium]|nr:queuosine precursor transporter [Bacteroidales bacterium]